MVDQILCSRKHPQAQSAVLELLLPVIALGPKYRTMATTMAVRPTLQTILRTICGWSLGWVARKRVGRVEAEVPLARTDHAQDQARRQGSKPLLESGQVEPSPTRLLHRRTGVERDADLADHGAR